MIRFILIAAAVVVGLVSDLSAATYYVRMTGNNANPGTSLLPFLTVGKGASVATNAGDTVIVGDGTYLERVTLPASGTSNAPITIRAENRRQAHIGGFIAPQKWFVIDGFEFCSQGAFSALVPSFDGMISLTSNTEHCYIINNWMHDSNTAANNKAMFVFVPTTAANALASPTGGLRYALANVGGCSFPVSNSFVAVGPSAGWITVSNNLSSNITYNAYSLLGHDHLLISNTIAMNQNNDGFRLFGNNHQLIGNEMYGSVDGPGNHPDWLQTFAIPEWPNELGGINMFTCTNWYIAGNYIHDAETALCQIEANQQYTCQNNSSVTFNTYGDIGNFRFENNLFVNVFRPLTIDAPNCSFINNTFYKTPYESNQGQAMVFTKGPKGDPTNAVILNNIFEQCGGNPASSSQGFYRFEGFGNNTNDPTEIWITSTRDYNFMAGTAGAAKSTNTNLQGAPFTLFYQGFGEAHGINGGTINFVNAVGSDFRLATNSPALSAGSLVTAIDFTGASRPQGAGADIGAFESAFGSAPASPPSAPSGLSASASGCSTINLIWTDNATDETAYEVLRSTDGVNFFSLVSIGANSIGYSDATAAASTTYYYKVRCSNGFGNSGFSGAANATTPSCPPIGNNTFRLRVVP